MELGFLLTLKRVLTLDHYILIKKLEHYGVRGVTKELFFSYLENRKQFVSTDGFVSNTKHIYNGVQQGSVLGLLLFLIYVSGIHFCEKYSNTYHFADDTNTLYSDKSLEVLVNNINHDLESLYGWLKASK